MTDPAHDASDRAAELSPKDRLESWKEIATYLDKEVRTVQRWEKVAGLPVHRHSQNKVLNIYAYRWELDAWRNHPGMPPDAGNAGHTLESAPLVPAAPRRWGRLVAGAGVVLVAVVVGASLWQVRAPSLEFEERDWVLIADFENQTGGAIAAGTVEYALAQALGESRFVNVVPRARVVDTLGLMRQPPETAVDAAVGREIALRDGGIRALLTGRVDKLDSTYALSAVLVEPATGRTVASVREEAAGDSEFLPAVHRLSNWVRARLGEALADIERSARLEKVTTPSLSALQLFSEADALIGYGGKNDVAEGLLRQAVAEDPDFASGYMHLAWTIFYQRKPATEYLPPAERALELAERVSERERYFILGSYRDMLGQDEQAATAYEALLRLYPDHDWGTGNLAFTNQRLGRLEEARRLRVRRADLRPTHLRSTIEAAWWLLKVGDVAAAEPYIERARALASAEGAHPVGVMWASFLKIDATWLGRDAEPALAALNEVVVSGPPQASGSPQTSDARDRWLYFASMSYHGLGMLDTAHDMALQIASDRRRCEVLYLVALARDARQAARDSLRCLVRAARRGASIRTHALIWLARAGAPDEALEALEWWKAQPVDPERWGTAVMGLSPARVVAALMKIVRGELARLEGRLGETIPLLEQALAELKLNNQANPAESYLASDSLALAWLAQGEPLRAARVLDEAAAQPRLTTVPNNAFGWLTVELRRAQVYRQLGRVEEAEEIEAGLRTLLGHADPDHVILRELKRLSSGTPIPITSSSAN